MPFRSDQPPAAKRRAPRTKAGDGETQLDEKPGRKASQKKLPKKMSARRLENISLFYLQRFSATASQLKRVLLRRVERAIRVHGDEAGGTRAEMTAWVEDLVARQVRSGMVDDTVYAEGRTAMLRRMGRGPGKIRALLAAKGVSATIIDQAIRDTAEEADGSDAALNAAIAYAQRRRLGPFREGTQDADTKRKDLGALARAGFSFATAKQVFDLDPDDLP